MGVVDAGESRAAVVTRDMQRRAIQHIAAGMTTDLGPATMTIDSREYTDVDRFEAERENIFRRLPLLACLSADLPDLGSAYLFEDAGPSILILRNENGIEAFLNMCTHRGAKLVEAEGTFRRITCPFHAWTFGIDGRILALPGAAAFSDIDRACRSLVRVPCTEWNGMVFVKAHAGEEPIDVEAYLGAFAAELAMFDFASMSRVARDRIDVAANWKTALDTYLECYHFATLHRDGLAKTHLSDVMIHDAFDPHCRVSYTPREFIEWAGKPEAEWPVRVYEGVHLLFPNTIVNINDFGGAPSLGLYRLYPGETVGQAFSTMTTYAPASLPEGRSLDEWSAGHDFVLNTVRTEDYTVAETGWHNLSRNSEPFKLILGRNELGVQALHRNIAKFSGVPLD